MSARNRSRVWKSVTLACALLAVALLGAWLATRGRNGWSPSFPRYAALHRGSVFVLSSTWDPPPASAGEWIYDVLGSKLDARWPPLRHIGNAYSTGPVRWGGKLRALEVPLWSLAALCAGAAVMPAFRWRRWAREARGGCPRCGYSREGLAPGAACPECGAGGDAGDTETSREG